MIYRAMRTVHESAAGGEARLESHVAYNEAVDA